MDLSRRPDETEVFSYQRNYVAKVPDGNILTILEHQAEFVRQFVLKLPASELDVVHPPYGWSVRTVIEHCCDAERVFGYRALRFATGEGVELPGWDENHFASCGYAGRGTAADLANEFYHSRHSNLHLLKRLQATGWDLFGTANSMQATVRTLAWLMAGHWLHHEEILCKRMSIGHCEN